MGTESYAVTRLSNLVALELSLRRSLRNVSRNRAPQTSGHEQVRAVSGIEYRETDAFRDEIPAAYKKFEQFEQFDQFDQFDQVSPDTAELVMIILRLR